MIHSFDNTDKHQALVPVWAGFRNALLLRESLGVNTAMASTGAALPVKDGDVIFRQDSLWPDPKAELKALFGFRGPAENYKVKFALEIAFGEIEAVKGQPVIPTLHQLIEFTERIVSIFGRYIFK